MAGDGYRTGSGSHRVVRRQRRGRRPAVVLAGVGTGIGACALAALAILGGTGVNDDRGGSGQVVSSGATDGSPGAKAERSLVPDACTLVNDQLAGKLAPDAERNQADNYQSGDRQNQCVWGAYAGDRKRQLTVELRAIAGTAEQTPTDAARTTFSAERRDDESGKALLAGQQLADKRDLTGVGDEGYTVYSVDKGQGSGEAIANVRVVNVMITIHYSGADGGSPLGSGEAVDGVTQTAEAVAKGLSAS